MNHIASPRTDDAGIEAEIQAKGLTAPRVSLEEFNANIVDTEIVKHVSVSGQILRWAVLTTRSGFAVTGRPSAAVSAENDDPEIGVATAIKNAREELWPLMGYELRSRLAAEPKPKVYTWSDIATYETDRSSRDCSVNFIVRMRDGKSFSGNVPGMLERFLHGRGKGRDEAILAECNKQAAASN